MCNFLLVIFSLISASAAEMSRATTTREFRWCFPQNWVNADQVRVSCNYIQIAQYCSPDQSCGNKTSPGVSLEKGKDGVCLTITSCSYDSWSCEAKSYISDKEHNDTFTVNVCNQPTSTLPSPGSTSTLPSPGNNEPLSGSFEAVWGPIVGLIIFGLIIYFCYKKVERFKIAICKFWSYLKCLICCNKKQDMAERMGIGEKMRTNGATGGLGVSEATVEIGERDEMGKTGEVGDMRAREETEETEQLLPHTQNNTKCIRPNIL